MFFMIFYPDKLYHIFNRGNNKQNIFIEEKNYHFFLNKVQKEITPLASVLAYCLMPNHFHLLIYTKSWDEPKSSHDLNYCLNKNIGALLRSYTRAINKNYNRTGSLFQQGTKAKLLDNHHENYAFICFNYIYQNPLKAGLVKQMEDWRFSSFNTYLGKEKHALINKDLAYTLLDIPKGKDEFYMHSKTVIDKGYWEVEY